MRIPSILALAVLVAGAVWFLVRSTPEDGGAEGGAVPVGRAAAPAPEDEPVPANLEAPAGDAEVAARTARRTVESDAPQAAAARDASRKATGEPARLTGRVVDTLGRPVADADVLVRVGPGFLDADETAGRRLSVASDGTFALEGTATGEWRFVVGADGYEPLERSEVAVAGVERDLGNLVLAPGVVLSGRVVDGRGRPVAGARIARPRPAEGGVFFLLGGDNGIELTETDADGSFNVARLAAGKWTLLAEHEEHPEARLEGEELAAGQRLDGLVIVMADGASISGRVTGLPDSAGPDASFVVRWSPLEQSAGGVRIAFEGLEMLGFGRSTAVDRDGRFEIKGLRAGEACQMALYRVVAANAVGGERRSAAVTATAGDANVTLAHGAGALVTLKVVDAASGAPIETLGASSGFGFAMPRGGPGGEEETHYPGGIVSFESLWPKGDGQDLHVAIDAPGYAPWSRDDVRVRPGDTVDLGTIALEPRPQWIVRVVDAKGAPIEGAEVALIEIEELAPEGPRIEGTVRFRAAGRATGAPRSFGGQFAERGRTDADGVVRLAAAPGADLRLRARAAGFATWTSERLAPLTQGTRSIEAVLAAGGAVVVTVVDASGAPAPGVAVEHRAARQDERDFQELASDDGGRARTDASGEIRFDHLAPGVQAFRLAKEAEEGAFVVRLAGAPEPAGEAWTEVEVSEGGEHAITLAVPLRARLAGTVMEDGKPLGRARVRVVERGVPDVMGGLLGGESGTPTDGAGRFELENLALGDVTLEIRHPSRAMPAEVRLTLVAGDNTERIDLSVSILEGKVVDEAGEPVEGALVKAKRKGTEGAPQPVMVMVARVSGDGGGSPSVAVGGPGREVEARTDADGRYSLRGVAPDAELVVTATKRGFHTASSDEVRVAPGAVRTQVDVVMRVGGKLRVTYGAAGSWMALATFEGEGGGVPQAGPQLLQNGECVLEDLAPGPWRVQLRSTASLPGEPGLPTQTAEVRAREETKVAF